MEELRRGRVAGEKLPETAAAPATAAPTAPTLPLLLLRVMLPLLLLRMMLPRMMRLLMLRLLMLFSLLRLLLSMLQVLAMASNSTSGSLSGTT